MQADNLSGGSDPLYFYQGDGSGGFATPVQINVPGLEIRNTATGDFNGDGTIDMAVTGGILGESVVSVLLNTGMVTGIASDEDPVSSLQEIFVLGQNYPMK